MMLPVGSLVHFNQRLWWVLTLASFRGCLCIVSWSRNLKIVYEFRLHYWYTSSELQWSFGSSQAEVIAFQLMLSTSALVSSVQKKNSSKIGMMLWPPESQLSLNANRVHAKPSLLACGFRLGHWAFGRCWKYNAELWRHQNCQFLSSPRQFNAISASKWSCVGRPKKSLRVDDKIISWNVGSIT